MTAGKSLYQALSDYAASDFYPYHMPGHKRNPAGGEMADYHRIDVTEIDGFDNLHQAEGILRRDSYVPTAFTGRMRLTL